jgi:hypothetical protein
MLPAGLIRCLVLAPVVVVLSVALIVLFPLLAVLALVFKLIALPRAGHVRSLRLVGFELI